MSIVVVDAATVVDLVCHFPAAEPYRAVLASAEAVAAPAHLDAEVLSALGRLKRAGRLTRAAERVEALAAFAATRWPLQPLLSPAWELVDRIATRDALYVALAVSSTPLWSPLTGGFAEPPQGSSPSPGPTGSCWFPRLVGVEASAPSPENPARAKEKAV